MPGAARHSAGIRRTPRRFRTLPVLAALTDARAASTPGANALASCPGVDDPADEAGRVEPRRARSGLSWREEASCFIRESVDDAGGGGGWVIAGQRRSNRATIHAKDALSRRSKLRPSSSSHPSRGAEPLGTCESVVTPEGDLAGREPPATTLHDCRRDTTANHDRTRTSPDRAAGKVGTPSTSAVAEDRMDRVQRCDQGASTSIGLP